MDFKTKLIEEKLVEDGCWKPHAARLHSGNLISEITSNFENLVGRKAASYSEAAYFAYHDMKAVPPCKNCNKPVEKYVTFKDGYRDYCSVKCAKSDPEIIARTKATSLAKYGVSNVSQSSAVRKKRSETMQERYGDAVYYRTEDFKAKSKKTIQENFGVDHQMHSVEVKAKVIQTSLERYGKNFSYRTQENLTEYGKGIFSSRENLINAIQTDTVIGIAEKAGVTFQTVYQYCSKFDIPKPRSSYEQEIGEWLNSCNIDFESNRKTNGRELDFVINETIAIEFNGLYYHTAEHLDGRGQNGRDYHFNKHRICKDAGIRLLMINEDEWLARKESIKRKILNLVGKSEKGVGARKLSVRKISNATANEFVDTYHIQGRTGAAMVSYGAYDGFELAAVIQYSQQRGTHDIELIRFCTDGKLYAGVFSRLFKASVKEEGYTKVISFADLRYSDGGVYQTNGFVLEDTIRPDYRYVKGQQTFHKSSFTKASISKKFGIDMTDRTEREAMVELGYRRIYDCGKLKYVWYS